MSFYPVCINLFRSSPANRRSYRQKNHLNALNKVLIDHEYCFLQGYIALTPSLLRHPLTQTCHFGWRGDDSDHSDSGGGGVGVGCCWSYSALSTSMKNTGVHCKFTEYWEEYLVTMHSKNNQGLCADWNKYMFTRHEYITFRLVE